MPAPGLHRARKSDPLVVLNIGPGHVGAPHGLARPRKGHYNARGTE